MDGLVQFHDAMRAAGLEPPDVIEPGKLHRFPGIGKRHGNTAGWCRLFPDGMGGCFGDWSSGLSAIWLARRGAIFSRAEWDTFTRHEAEARTHAEKQLEAMHAEAAKRASAIWNAAPPARDDHPYLRRKGIKAHGARQHHGALTIPVVDFFGTLTSLQFIDADGTKRLLSGGRKRGCFMPVASGLEGASRVIICEGWATGCTLAEDDPDATVLAAIDAGNLMLVAVAARCRWPLAELVIAGDDDRLTPGNPGATKAKAAALAADALLAMPQWPADAPETLTDFNDLAIWLERTTR